MSHGLGLFLLPQAYLPPSNHTSLGAGPGFYSSPQHKPLCASASPSCWPTMIEHSTPLTPGVLLLCWFPWSPSSPCQSVRLIRAKDEAEGVRVGKQNLNRPSARRCAPGWPQTCLWDSRLELGGYQPDVGKHSWMKPDRPVFPVALFFKGKKELNFQGKGKAEALGQVFP